MSTGTAFLMLLSLEPAISQESSTSHSATPFESSMAFFSSMLCGTAQPSTRAMSGQKRFCGWP